MNELLSKEVVQQRVTEAVNASGFTKTKIANEIGVSRGALSNWVSGRDQPTESNLIKLAVLLDRPVEYFTGNPNGANRLSVFESGLVKLPCLGLDGAKDSEVEAPLALFHRHNVTIDDVLATMMTDNRMAPALPLGTMCCFDKSGEVKPGLVVLVSHLGRNRVARYFPQIMGSDTESWGVRLSFDGPECPDEQYREDAIEILGVLYCWVCYA